MARKTQLDIVREAIEIQGFVTVYVDGQSRKVSSIEVVNGEWVTDVMTRDLCGYVRIKKTKKFVVEQARKIIANADEIRAARESEAERAQRIMMDS